MASGVRMLHHQYHGETGWEIHVPVEVRMFVKKALTILTLVRMVSGNGNLCVMVTYVYQHAVEL